MVWRLRFSKGILVDFLGGGGGKIEGGRIRPQRPVADLNNTTINERTRGRGLERPGDGLATMFLEWDVCRILGGGG